MGIRRRRGAIRLRRRRPSVLRARQGGAARPAHSFLALGSASGGSDAVIEGRPLQEARSAVHREHRHGCRRGGRAAQRALQDPPARAGLPLRSAGAASAAASGRAASVDRQEPRREGRMQDSTGVHDAENPSKVERLVPRWIVPRPRPDARVSCRARPRRSAGAPLSRSGSGIDDSLVPLSHLPCFPASGNPQICPLTWVLETGDRIAQRHPALQTYVRALSPRSRYNRFLGAVNELPASELARALAAKRGPCSSPRRPTASNGCSAMCCAPTRG